LPDISIIAMQPNAKQNTSQHGLTKTDGMTTTQFPIVQTKNQAISIRSLMFQGQSKMVWKRILTNGDDEIEDTENLTPWDIQEKYQGYRLVNIQEEIHTDMTEEEKAIVFHYSQPADYKTIHSHLLRLAVHKRMTGNDKEKELILREYINRLKGVTELQIFDAVEWFIDNDDSDFFPNLAKIKSKIL